MNILSTDLCEDRCRRHLLSKMSERKKRECCTISDLTRHQIMRRIKSKNRCCHLLNPLLPQFSVENIFYLHPASCFPRSQFPFSTFNFQDQSRNLVRLLLLLLLLLLPILLLPQILLPSHPTSCTHQVSTKIQTFSILSTLHFSQLFSPHFSILCFPRIFKLYLILSIKLTMFLNTTTPDKEIFHKWPKIHHHKYLFSPTS